MTETLSLNYREAIQTPGSIPRLDTDLLCPGMDPPGEIVADRLEKLIARLEDMPETYVELPNPMSSPSQVIKTKRWVEVAKKKGVGDRVAIHTRLLREDVQLALDCGAVRIYFYGSLLFRNGGQKTVGELLGKTEEVAQLAVGRAKFLRASLEHATQTPEDKVAQFVSGIQNINRKLNDPIIKGLGLPDTNGVAMPVDYERLMGLLAKICPGREFTLFAHLHDDSGRAVENWHCLLYECRRYGFNLCM